MITLKDFKFNNYTKENELYKLYYTYPNFPATIVAEQQEDHRLSLYSVSPKIIKKKTEIGFDQEKELFASGKYMEFPGYEGDILIHLKKYTEYLLSDQTIDKNTHIKKNLDIILRWLGERSYVNRNKTFEEETYTVTAKIFGSSLESVGMHWTTLDISPILDSLNITGHYATYHKNGFNLNQRSFSISIDPKKTKENDLDQESTFLKNLIETTYQKAYAETDLYITKNSATKHSSRFGISFTKDAKTFQRNLDLWKEKYLQKIDDRKKEFENFLLNKVKTS